VIEGVITPLLVELVEVVVVTLLLVVVVVPTLTVNVADAESPVDPITVIV
jgi:hypothetical protein